VVDRDRRTVRGTGRERNRFHIISLPERRPSLEKSLLRKRLLEARLAMDEAAYRQFSERICRHLESLPRLAEAGCVHTFWPMIARREPDIRPFIEQLVSRSVRLALPVLRSPAVAEPGAPRMNQVAYGHGTRLITSSWGIDEPEGEMFVSRRELDAVIVPALGVDPAGYRIGYGLGYYDEFLSEVNATLVCPIFSRCLIDRVPLSPHDVPVHFIVTEDGVLEARKM